MKVCERWMLNWDVDSTFLINLIPKNNVGSSVNVTSVESRRPSSNAFCVASSSAK